MNITSDKKPQKREEHWIKSHWRPAMAWIYALICLMDFVVFPMLAMFLPVIYKSVSIVAEYTPWASLTLTNGGLIHVAFGAIIGIAAYSRGIEKIRNKN